MDEASGVYPNGCWTGFRPALIVSYRPIGVTIAASESSSISSFRVHDPTFTRFGMPTEVWESVLSIRGQ
jgi:hypothetical protein